jgi:hypothetical protein
MKKIAGYSSLWPWFMVVFVSFLVAACGGGGGRSTILGAGDISSAAPPTVTVVAPSPNAVGVPTNTSVITAAFSKAMDSASLNTSSFTLACPAPTPISGGVVSYLAASRTAMLTLPIGFSLPPATLCTATVTSAARDTLGFALVSNFVWQFTTGTSADTTAPTVTSTINANGATNVAVNTKMGATFSEPMAPSTITSTSFTLRQGTSLVAGTTSYSGVSAVFTPASNLAFNTLYTATVTTAATDLAGNPMANNYVWSWTTGAATDTSAPTVIGTSPADSASNVAINTRVGATFSEAMDPLTITNVNFALKEFSNGANVPGVISYSGVNAAFVPLANLAPATRYTVTVKGGVGGVEDLAGNAMVSDFAISWTTAAGAVALDTTPPTVVLVNPADLATGVAIDSAVNVTFNEAMDPLTISTANFKVAGVTGTVAFNALSKVATFTPAAPLANNTTYTATVTNGVADLAGNHMVNNKVWSFTTVAIPVVMPIINLVTAAPYGTFGGSAGMTNTGTLTQVNGDIGTIATGTSMVTGFHDTGGDIYTQTPANIGAVNGKIYTCTNSVTGPTSTGTNAVSCAKATQARLDAEAAYLTLAGLPVGANPGGNLANLTLLPGTYTAPAGSFLIEGGNLTLDAQGNANAVWVFQMATTLTVGGPGAAFPQSIILSGGALAKNVYWQVGSFATINAAGGGTMVGTIISQMGASFSTAGNTNIVTLQGRVLSLGASVTLVDTVINVPAP